MKLGRIFEPRSIGHDVFPSVQELPEAAEVNPLFVYEDRVVPVDARVVLLD